MQEFLTNGGVMKAELGKRIKAERERKKVSQEKLAKAVGWNHHQIVSEIEQGSREVKVWELQKIANFLSVNMDVLLGNKELSESSYVLWRKKPEQDEKLLEARFLSECANYVWIEQTVSGSERESAAVFEELTLKKIDIKKFTFEDAYTLAGTIRQHMGLGDFPVTQLVGVLEDRYDIKFIVDHEDIEPSAACSRSEKGCFIFINGRNIEPRQYFSIAHELFHLITWDLEMLQLIDSDPKFHKKNEQLADAFAAGLLIPQEKLQSEVEKICASQAMGPADVIALSEQFQVSKKALLYRLLNVRLITEKQFNEIDSLLPKSPPTKTSFSVVHPLKRKFVRLVYLACEHVKITRAKAAKLLNIDLCDLSNLFNEYGFVELNV